MEKIDKQVRDLKFEITRNIMYQNAREGWYGRWHKFVMFFATILGTSAAISVLGTFPTWTSVLFGLLVAAATTLDLVFDLSGQARKHNGLRQRFFAILADLEDCVEDGSDLSAIRKRLYALYGEEPTVLRALDATCWNQAFQSINSAAKFEELIHVSRYESFMKHILPFENSKFPFNREIAKG